VRRRLTRVRFDDVAAGFGEGAVAAAREFGEQR